MANSTYTAALAGSKSLLINGRNAYQPYLEKDVFIYSEKLIVADSELEADGNLSLVLPGVTEVEGFSFVEDRAGTFAQIVPSSITYTTTAGAVSTTIVLAINASTTALHLFIVAKV